MPAGARLAVVTERLALAGPLRVSVLNASLLSPVLLRRLGLPFYGSWMAHGFLNQATTDERSGYF